jgi:hypothetical protein
LRVPRAASSSSNRFAQGFSFVFFAAEAMKTFLSRGSHARVIAARLLITTDDILDVTTWRGADAI